MNISVLGSGWLGLPLAIELLKRGHFIKLSTRNKKKVPQLTHALTEAFTYESQGQTGHLLAEINVVDIDALPSEGLDKVLLADSFLESEILIINITSKDPVAYQSLINHLYHSSIKKVIFVSATSVYQSENTDCFENKSPLSNSPLVEIESLFHGLDSIDVSTVRLAGLVGRKRHPGRFFRRAVIEELNNNAVSIRTVSDPDAPVNMIHRDDAIGIICAIIEKEAWGEVFNGCADTHPSKREYYTHTSALLGFNAPHFSPLKRSEQAAYKQINNEKVKRVLGYAFIYPDVMDMDYSH